MYRYGRMHRPYTYAAKEDSNSWKVEFGELFSVEGKFKLRVYFKGNDWPPQCIDSDNYTSMSKLIHARGSVDTIRIVLPSDSD